MLHSLSLLTTSFLIAEHEANPDLGKGFVTIPAVEQHFGATRENSGALVIAYVPEVPPSEVDAWNQYSKEKQGWIQQSHGPVNVTDTIMPSIWEPPPEERIRFLADGKSTCGASGGRRLMSAEARADRTPIDSEEGPFSPVWTFSPPPLADDVSIINFNLRTKPVFQKAVDYIAANRLPTFLDVCNQAAWFDNQGHEDILQTVIAVPVFSGYDEETADVVGHLVAIIPWEVFFQDILLIDTPPLRAVLENTCDEVFTFEIKGRDANFLSEEDLHDKAYADMAIKSSFADIVHHHGNDTRSKEIGAQACQYTISVYPTETFEREYLTNEPILFASVVIGVFFVSSLLFVIFDRFVRKRTEKVMNVAFKQNAIVSSLFPKAVQAKMMAEAEQNEKLGKLGKAGIKSFLNADKLSGEADKDALVSSKPIAGKHHCAAVSRSHSHPATQSILSSPFPRIPTTALLN